MRKISIGLLVLFSFGAAATPKTSVLILGGGGDPPGQNTLFDDDLVGLHPLLWSPDYKTVVAYDGGHPATEAMVRDNYGTSAKPFTAKGASDQIQVFQDNMEQLPARSQALIIVDTHGAPFSGSGIHQVEMADGKRFDLARLESLQTVAKKKGIKLAIVDLSCYSGLTLELAKKDPQTCVMTAAARDRVSYVDFAHKFVAEIGRGKSLEAVFLAARAKSEAPGNAEISTGAGRAAAETLKSLHWLATDTVDFRNAHICQDRHGNPVVFSGFLDFLDRLPPTLLSVQNGKILLPGLLDEYAKERAIAAKTARYLKTETIVEHLRFPMSCLIKLKECLEIENKFLKKGNDPASAKQLSDLDGKLYDAKERLLNSDPQFQEAAKWISPAPGERNLTVGELKIYQTGASIKAVEKQLYQQLYSRFEAGQSKKEQEPCREFIF